MFHSNSLSSESTLLRLLSKLYHSSCLPNNIQESTNLRILVRVGRKILGERGRSIRRTLGVDIVAEIRSKCDWLAALVREINTRKEWPPERDRYTPVAKGQRTGCNLAVEKPFDSCV